jgi:cell division protein FtsQ
MARKDEEFYRSRTDDGAAQPRRSAVLMSRDSEESEEELDERVANLDLESDEESPFLRAQKRVPVRRGPLPRKAAISLKYLMVAMSGLLILGGLAAWFYTYGTGSWRFRIDSSDNLEVAGVENVTHSQVLQVFGADIGRNIFFVPLDQRRRQLQELPWVESATVMRLLPNRIRIQIKERTPVAFVRIGSKVSLIDAQGVVLEMPAKGAHDWSFPVITGMQESEPLSTRAARMKTFMRLVNDLDSTGARYSQALSEVDLSDPDDVKATVADSSGAVLVHLGNEQFLERYKIYLAHVQEWRQQFSHLDSVDLRYDRQVVVNPDSGAERRSLPSLVNSAPPATGKTGAHAPVRRH